MNKKWEEYLHEKWEPYDFRNYLKNREPPEFSSLFHCPHFGQQHETCMKEIKAIGSVS
jgi:hypothetical protein